MVMAWEMMKLILPLMALVIPTSCFTLENRNNTPPPCTTKNKESFDIGQGGVYINIYLIKQRFETCSCHCHYPQETFVSLDDNDERIKGKSGLDVKLNMSLEDKEKRGECSCKSFILPYINQESYPFIKGIEKEFCSACSCKYQELGWENILLLLFFVLGFCLSLLVILYHYNVRIIKDIWQKNKEKKKERYLQLYKNKLNKNNITDADEVTVGISSTTCQSPSPCHLYNMSADSTSTAQVRTF